MDKSKSWFLKYLSVILLVAVLVIMAMLVFYTSSSLKLYNSLFVTVMALLSIAVVAGLVSALSLVYAYNNRRLPKVLILPFLAGLKLLLPLLVFIAGILGGESDSLRTFYIELNNFFTEATGKRFRKEDIILLLPHCLQNSDCSIRITKDINMCRECGRCRIGDIVALLREKGVRAKVVTGGTAARKAIEEMRPKAVLAVACERDLSLGLIESGRMPVIGVANIRPNGPCNNTQVDMEILKKKLELLLS